MNEKEVMISHALDLKERSASQSIVTSTNFLSVEELSDIIKTERINNEFVDTFYYGGHLEAERKVAVFVPSFYSVTEDELEVFLNNNSFNPLSVLEITKDRFAVLSHRDYLGALMGLGIKREMIGDILVNSEGCTLFCLKSIEDYICANLSKAGRGQLCVKKADVSKLVLNESKTEISFISVASLRLDCLVAAAFRLSRTGAVNFITQGTVYVNGEQITKTDYILKENDKLVLRGKGKTVIEKVIGESKKGRMHINLKRYI